MDDKAEKPNTLSYIVGLGAANVDVCGKSLNAINMRDSNPGAMKISAGGVTRNVCENLSRLGVQVKLITAIGNDIYGDMIRSSCMTVNIDTSCFYTAKGRPSSSYISILDQDGDMLVALSDMSISKCLTPEYIRSKAAIINGAELIVCDPSLPPETMDALLDTAEVPIYLDPVSTAYAAVVADKIGRFHTAKPNRMEAEILSGVKITDDSALERACDTILDKGLQRIFVSLGAEGCFYKDRSGYKTKRALTPLKSLSNATGGGDAFMAAVIYKSLCHASVDDTLDFALAAGLMAVQADTTVNPDISVLNIEKALKENRI